MEKIKEIKQNKLLIVLFVFTVLLVFLSIGYYRVSVVPVNVFSEKGAENGTLIPLNLSAKKAYVKNGDTAFYKFSDVHKILLKHTYAENKTASVVFRVTVKFPSGKKLSHYENAGDIPLKIGFLDSSDFDSKGRLVFNFVNHNSVTCNLRNTIDIDNLTKTYDISFALPSDKVSNILEMKEGVFISSEVSCWLQSVVISSSKTGFDLSGDIDFWGFSSNGGTLSFDTSSFDFTGSSNIFPVLYSEKNVPPEITIKMYQPLEGELLDYNFTFGGEKLKVSRLEEINLSSLSLKNPFSFMTHQNRGDNVQAILFHSGKEDILSHGIDWPVVPIKTDPGLILGWPKSNWRNPDYELFEWDRLPGILFFDTKDYAVQSKFFARIAFFTEKEGYKGMILSNEELMGKHDYNAHDYSAESFARFFNKAFRLNFHLNPEEELLLEILVRNGILERGTDPLDPYVSKGGAVLSVSREIPSYNRKSLLAHEGWHTIFFTDEEFRNYVSAVYNVMDPFSMQFLIDYFKSQSNLGYDTNDSYLMHNEFMAYILQNTEGNAGSYFVNKASWPSVKKVTPDLCRYIIETGGSGFDDCQAMLQDFLYDKYKLKSGNIGLCSY